MNKDSITVPAAALAMGVSRIVIERAIKQNALEVSTFNSGGKNPGFRLVSASSLKSWLEGRKGYHEAQKNGSTKFHPWNNSKNPANIVANALLVTNTDRVPKKVAKPKAKKAKVVKTEKAAA